MKNCRITLAIRLFRLPVILALCFFITCMGIRIPNLVIVKKNKVQRLAILETKSKAAQPDCTKFVVLAEQCNHVAFRDPLLYSNRTLLLEHFDFSPVIVATFISSRAPPAIRA